MNNAVKHSKLIVTQQNNHKGFQPKHMYYLCISNISKFMRLLIKNCWPVKHLSPNNFWKDSTIVQIRTLV